MALVGLAVALGLYAWGKIDWFDALLFGLFSIAIGTWWVWGFRRLFEGTVELTRDGIMVRGRDGRGHDYEWKDIADVRLITPRGYIPRDWAGARLGAVDERPPFVEVRLSRPRLPLVGDRWGTLWAIPGLGPKTVKLYVEDPEGLVRAAQSFLWRPLDAGRI